jgi:hypothetical protein
MRPARNASSRTRVPLSSRGRAIKSGRISGQRDATRAWSVEAVELHRVFPPAEATPRAVPQDAQTDALVAELRAQLAKMRAQRDDMRSQRDAWQGIAERLALGAPKPEPAPEPKPRPWSWRWLRST